MFDGRPPDARPLTHLRGLRAGRSSPHGFLSASHRRDSSATVRCRDSRPCRGPRHRRTPPAADAPARPEHPNIRPPVNVHLIDGTYELFRHFYAVPSRTDRAGREVGALLGVLHSLLGMLEAGATHIGVATDHVIESFRNELWPGYKSSAGIDPALWAQFHPMEGALAAMGVAVWPMVELEADDGMASAARLAGADPEVERIFICTPDKDLSQCVSGTRIVQFDRRQRTLRDEEGVVDRFGVRPASIPDYLALVGDSADGFPGIPGWGAKSTAAVLGHYGHLEAIPLRSLPWGVAVRGAARLQENLRAGWRNALLFRDLATLRDDASLFDDPEELRWTGPTPGFERVAEALGDARLADRVERAASGRGRGRAQIPGP